MEHAVETMQLGGTVTDLRGRIVYTNPADASLHGYSPEELIGKDDTRRADCLPNSDVEALSDFSFCVDCPRPW